MQSMHSGGLRYLRSILRTRLQQKMYIYSDDYTSRTLFLSCIMHSISGVCHWPTIETMLHKMIYNRMETKDPFSPHNRHDCCLYHGDAKAQDISSRGVDVFPDCSGNVPDVLVGFMRMYWLRCVKLLLQGFFIHFWYKCLQILPTMRYPWPAGRYVIYCWHTRITIPFQRIHHRRSQPQVSLHINPIRSEMFWGNINV